MRDSPVTIGRCIAALVLALSGVSVHGVDFRAGEWEGLVNFDVSYGALWRFEEADARLVALASGGKRPDSNVDDGTLNFDDGLASNMVRANGQLTLIRGDFGLFVRGGAYYDYELVDQDRQRTPLSGGAEDDLGKDAVLQEAFVSYSFAPKGVPVFFRVGDQVLSWSQSTFIRDGLDIINPVDLGAALQPATQGRDAVVPQGMLWGAVSVSEAFSVEGFYQYEWKPLRLPPIGSLFSPNDLFGGGQGGSFTMGGGGVSDLGTDLDDLFALPAGTLGFDENYMQFPSLGKDEARDGGQWGLALQALLPGRNVLSLGLHYIRYHSRLPLFSGLTGSAAAVAATSPAAVAARTAKLIPVYLAEGLSGQDAAAAASFAAQELTISGYANAAGFRAVYPEDIDMIALSFSTATLRTGTLVSGEISHHRDVPFQIGLGTFFGALLSPIEFDPNLGNTPLGEYGPDEVVGGFVKLDRTQASVNLTQLFTRRLGAAQVALALDAAWVHVHDMPGMQEAPLQASAPATADSYGYRLLATALYPGVFGSTTLSPRVVFSHDFSGTTPAPSASFVEGRKSLTLGTGVNVIDRVTVVLDYTRFFGAGRSNLLRDRDFARFRVTYWL